MNRDANELRRNWSAHMRNGDEFELLEVVGHGTFGQVLRGYFKSEPGRPIAKRLLGLATHGDEITIESQRFFMRELEVYLIMSSTPTIAEFFGYSVAPDKALYTEYLPNGSLARVLASPNPHWTDTVRAQTIFGFACAMMHLHNNGAMHRYLSPGNILFDAHWEPRLVDFGFAKTELDIGQTQLHANKNIPYLAPELINGDDEYGPPIDVYAFGIIIWQIVTGEVPPTNPRRGRPRDRFIPPLPAIPAGTATVLAEIMTSCWHPGAQSRPQFYEIVRHLLHYNTPLFPGVDMTAYQLYRARTFEQSFKSPEAQLCFDADDIGAFARVRASADATGNAADCTRAGLMLDAGRGTARDPAAARAYLTRGAQGGDPAGMYQLAKRLANGRYGGQARPEGIRWMERAAAIPGNVTAQVEFAMMLVMGLGAEADPGRGIRLLEAAAAEPHSDCHAQFQLAKQLRDGENCEQDLPRARRLLQLAAAQGMEAAVNDLASMELRGQGGEKDVPRAVRTLQQAVDRGNPEACVNLALIRDGKEPGLPAELLDREEAVRLYRRAEELGNPRMLMRAAVAKFREIERRTDLEPKQKREGQRKVLEMFKRAADGGDVTAMSNYGKLRIEGWGMKKNPYEGYLSLIRAAEMGFSRAFELLAQFVREGNGGIESNAERADRLAECARSRKKEETAVLTHP